MGHTPVTTPVPTKTLTKAAKLANKKLIEVANPFKVLRTDPSKYFYVRLQRANPYVPTDLDQPWCTCTPRRGSTYCGPTPRRWVLCPPADWASGAL